MKKLAVLFFSISNLIVFAEDSLLTKQKEAGSKWSIGVNISPDYCNRILENDYGGDIGRKIIGSRNNSEQFKIGYSAGLGICYSINRNIGIELGVVYADRGYSTKERELTFGDMIDPRFGFTYPTSGSGTPGQVALKIYYNHIYIDIPIRANFAFGQKKYRFIAGIGLSTGILLRSTQKFVYDSSTGTTSSVTHNQNETYNKVNLFPEISMGIERQLSKKLILRIQPVFKYGIMKIIDTPITAYLWSGGLNMGCYYLLK